MSVREIFNNTKTLLTQKLSRRALIFFAAVFFIGFLVVGVTATEGIGNLVEAYRLSRERVGQTGLPQASNESKGKETILKKMGKVFGILPQNDTVQVTETKHGEQPGEVELTPEEEKILVEIPDDITSAQESIVKISDLISEATLDIIIEADETPLTTFIVDKVFVDYPEVSKVMTSTDVRNALAPKITEAFQNQDFKFFLDSELQTLIKERVSDLVGLNPQPEALEKELNKNLSEIVMQNLPIILQKPTALNILTDSAYNGLNSISVFDTNLTARVVSNQNGDVTYSFDCHSDGSVERTNGPTTASTDSISSLCYYLRSSAANVSMSKQGVGNVTSSATVDISDNTINIKPVNQAPIIDVGSGQTVKEGTIVTLNGARSVDPEGNALSYTWTQTSGAAVSFSASSPSPSFAAPMLGKNENEEDIPSATLGFQMVIKDSEGVSASGSVNVTVVKDTPEKQIDTPVQYLAVSLSGISLGKVDYLNRVMGGALRQFSENQIKNYFNSSFATDAFGAFVNSNVKEMTVDIAKSTFRGVFITENFDGTPAPEDVKMSRGIYRESKSKESEFDREVIGPLFQTIQGYGSCRKSWHFITRCNCRCVGRAYLWDPMTRKCGCEK